MLRTLCRVLSNGESPILTAAATSLWGALKSESGSQSCSSARTFASWTFDGKGLDRSQRSHELWKGIYRRGMCDGVEGPSGLEWSSHDNLYQAMPEVEGEELELLDKFVDGVKEGKIFLEEVVTGLVDGHLNRQDLNYLLHKSAIDEFMYKQIITEAIGGTPKITFKEVTQMVKDRIVGKDDIVWMVKEGMLVPGDIQYLVDKEYMPTNVATAVLSECADVPNDDTRLGFSEIVSRVRSGEVSLEGVEAMVINGQLSSQDVDLLVEDGLVGQEDATKLLEDSQEEIDEAFTQANTFATLVVDGKVSHDELQVMRVKGVLGNSVIHFLVKEEAISHEQGAELIRIQEDPDQDGEGLEGIDRGCPDYEAFPQDETADADLGDNTASGAGEPNVLGSPGTAGGPEKETSAGSISEEGLDGFYPPHIDKDDILGLWDHLEKTYEGIPGLPDVEEILQEAADEEKDEKKRKRMAEEAKQEIEYKRAVDKLGRAYATGKRKCAISRVWIKEGSGDVQVNKMAVGDYFTNLDTRVHLVAPFIATSTLGQFDVMATVKGGGLSAQAQAVRHGISKALQNFDPNLRTNLKACGLLTRDAREVERKKPGRAKARKSFAWVKR